MFPILAEQDAPLPLTKLGSTESNTCVGASRRYRAETPENKVGHLVITSFLNGVVQYNQNVCWDTILASRHFDCITLLRASTKHEDST